MPKDNKRERNGLTTSSWSSSGAVINLTELPAEQTISALEPIACFYDAMPTGGTVSQQGRIFINFPKWGDNVQFTVGEFWNKEIIGIQMREQIRQILKIQRQH